VLIKLILFGLFLASAGAQAQTRPPPPVRDPALLNIGFVCRWQNACIAKQRRAMTAALTFVRNARPPAWKVQICNRNSGRNGTRKDWIGFNNCIRNPKVRRPAARRR